MRSPDRLRGGGLCRSLHKLRTKSGVAAVIVPRLKRRWFQFTLRTLLLAVLLASVGLSAFAVRRERVKREREAYAVLRQFRGIIRYDYQCDKAAANPNVPPGPAWLRSWLGDDFFANIEFVCLGGGDMFTDTELAQVGEFRDLKFLNLGGSAISDEGLEQLEGLGRLGVLRLDETKITDRGLEHLKGLHCLEELGLIDVRITDSGLEHLRGLTCLRELDLIGTNVTPEGVAALQECLPECEITY
jgi:hypothetical protein